MYRQNLKRKLEAVNREGVNLAFRKDRLAKRAAAEELRRERELEKVQREIIDAGPDSYGLQHQNYSDMLEEHAKKDFLETRLIDRGGYLEPEELRRQMDQPFEAEARVPLSAVRTGQTEANFEIENDEADPDYAERKLAGVTGLSRDDPFQRDHEDRTLPATGPGATVESKVTGLSML